MGWTAMFPHSGFGLCLSGTKSQPMMTAWHQHSTREVVAQTTRSILPLQGGT